MRYVHKVKIDQILVGEAALFLNRPADTLRRWDRERTFVAKRNKSGEYGYRYYTMEMLAAFKKRLKEFNGNPRPRN